MVALLASAGCGGGGSGGESAVHEKLASLCQQTTNGDSSYCGCVADETIKRGYDTDAEISQLQPLALKASQSGDTSQLPAPVVEALNACKSSAS